MYQFSAQETWDDWDWKERYPTQEDMQAYMRHVTDILKLRDYIVFNTRIESARWDDNRSCWLVYAAGGLFATATFLIPCTGYAGQKFVPDLPGLSTFKHAYHTSDWPEHLQYEGKRFAVIGTGSSGSQTIETVGPHVKHLTVFQRTPNLCNPRRQELLTPEMSKDERMGYPARYVEMHKSPTGLEVKPIQHRTFSDDDVTRKAVYEALWLKGAQNFWFGNYMDLLTDAAANREAYRFWRSKILPRIADPAKQAILCPEKPPHPFGAKRPSLEESYYEVFNQPNVDLVDLKSDPITQVTPHGIRLASGAFHELDLICLATGYDFAIGSQLAFPIKGAHGVLLKDKWLGSAAKNSGTCAADGGGLATHLGLMTNGFPNLLFPAGPQAPTAFGITPRLAELQGNWVADLLEYVRDGGHTTIEPTVKAEVKWKRLCVEAVEKTLIAEVDGWYMGNNVPGRKKQPLFWFGGLQEYMRHCTECRDKGFAGFKIQ